MSYEQAICPKCGLSDKVERVPVIVAEAFPTLATNAYITPRRWAGRLWFVPKPDFKNVRYEARIPLRLLPAYPRRKDTQRGGSGRHGVVYSKEIIVDDLRRPIVRMWIFFSAAILAIITSVLLGLTLFGILATIMAMLILAALGILHLLRFIMRKVPQEMMPLTDDYKLAHLHEAEERWELLSYCYRDEGVFMDGSGFIPLVDIETFLYTGQPYLS